MKSIILSLIAVAILFSGIFAVTTSTLMQSIAVLLIGAAALLASVSKLEVKLDRPSMVVSVGAFLYFLVRALLSPVYDLGVADLFLFLPGRGCVFSVRIRERVTKTLFLGVSIRDVWVRLDELIDVHRAFE